MQGVFFRESTRRMAETLGLAGWVRNRRDGSVEVMASGDAVAVAALQQWLATGPAHARVAAVHCREPPATGPLTGFVVRDTA